jgi:membrane protease YdiL (CAAX protease family)
VVVRAGFLAAVARGHDSELLQLELPSDLTMAKAVIAIAVAPLLEELLWRGAIFRKWRVRFGPRTALLLSSVLFGAMHDEKLASAIMGMTIALLYTRSGSLWAALLFHVANNAVGTAMAAQGTLHIGLGSGWSLTLFLLVCLTGSAAWLRFVLQSWRTLGAPLPPDSLQPNPAAQLSSLPEPLGAGG